jgi:hypothetical protein
MSNRKDPSPILCSPFEEPKAYRWILEGQPAECRPAPYSCHEPRREVPLFRHLRLPDGTD